MRSSDWSSDVCSSDLCGKFLRRWTQSSPGAERRRQRRVEITHGAPTSVEIAPHPGPVRSRFHHACGRKADNPGPRWKGRGPLSLEQRSRCSSRSEAHTSELQSLMRISYSVFCLYTYFFFFFFFFFFSFFFS